MVAIDELHEALSFEPAAGAHDSLQRQTQIVGDIRPGHRHRHRLAPRDARLPLYHAYQHRQPADRITACHDDVVVLRLTEYMQGLAEKLEFELAIALEQLRERV